ncbi:MAG: polyamine aminopropyltransferase, partial [Gammaproteobacteria bacterium]|nr:polyamine aminopropyltransferase [Gammaproteobacteria bacterium]
QCLTEDGILVTQNGVAYMQLDEVTTTAKRLQPYFSDQTFYSAAVPTYIGGIMTFAWASNNPALRTLSAETIAQRFSASNIKTRYYNPAIHIASFALPQYVLDALATKA